MTRTPAPTTKPGRTRARRTALALGLALTLAACGGTTRDSEEERDDAPAGDATADPDAAYATDLSVAMLPKSVNNPYFEASSEGAERVVDELAGSYEYTGPSDASASSQLSYVNTLSQQATDVVLLSANDPNALCSALEQARSLETTVVTFDSDVAPECRDVFVSQVDGAEVGSTLLEMTAEQIGGEGEIAILSATANATNQNAWIDTMEAELAENPDYADIELVAVAYGDDEDEKSFRETQGLLAAHPDLAAIVSPTTVGIAAAARYLQGSEYGGEVALTGLGTPNQMREFVADGTVTEFALWDPTALGELAAYAGAAVASGIITGAEGETFTAGELGEYTVGPDGVITLGPPTRFNADNIDDYDF
ncbi:rhamnose ABC transporter substrate-binding protein [Streptomyces sp. 3MP-14]|uniref:Rhamnose ABC transporter substrate-binding protein n=1 Tax=Streptomyces mimosae TaxID=2586635 RepID=A0A5N6A1L8_9ACTN|nr:MULTISPECIES: rhamnose ABC transporter substrate-binding protein [Streptomyces]KAB8162132.1 rhamnose ABC transporter substrate-binding protein [Streptomyces mimosae]KAB8173970.1 rhamnose ABC transporter substrate-binding protein [Streptomyces sp. 3MP-14]